MKYKAYVTSHGGNVRSNNEDNAYIHGYYREDDEEFIWNHEAEARDNMLAAVFDGMGGEKNGEVASRIAAETMNLMRNAPFSHVIEEYIEKTGKRIREIAGKSHTGTTYVAASIENNTYYFSNLGDSRGYLFRDGNLIRMSKDHNMVEELLQLGILTEEQAKKHPDRHTLYQYLGMKEDEDGTIIEPYKAKPIPVCAGDLCLICSDGLTEMVSEEQICAILSEPVELTVWAERLKECAIANGGIDNVTILLVQIL